jgi:thiol-disulfide isomerase/thioredoxin
MRSALLMFGLATAILLNGTAFASPAPADCASPPPALGRYKPTAEPRESPTATFLDAEGNEKSLFDFRGKGLVLNFWATWCAPCVKEMPALDRLAAAAGGRGLQVLALSADRAGAPVVRTFYEVNDISHLPVAIDTQGRVARAIGITGLPTTVLYDAAGREVGRVIGVAEWDTPAVLDFLAGCLAARG